MIDGLHYFNFAAWSNGKSCKYTMYECQSSFEELKIFVWIIGQAAISQNNP